MVLLGNEVRGEPASLVEVERTVRTNGVTIAVSSRPNGWVAVMADSLGPSPVPAWADKAPACPLFGRLCA